MEAYSQEAIEQGVSIVLFGAPWCGNCKRMHPAITRLEGVVKVPFYYADMELYTKYKSGMHRNGNILADKYNISFLPTIIIFKDGKEVERINGYKTYAELKSFFENVDKIGEIYNEKD